MQQALFGGTELIALLALLPVHQDAEIRQTHYYKLTIYNYVRHSREFDRLNSRSVALQADRLIRPSRVLYTPLRN